MKNRITAAWKVLRGEWVAHAPVKPSFAVYEPTTAAGTTSTTTNIRWTN